MVNKLSNHYDDQWKLLQKLKPTNEEKEITRMRIWQTIQASSPKITRTSPFFSWKNLLATCLFFLICGGFWLIFQQENKVQHSVTEKGINSNQISWKLEDMYSKKSNDGLAFYRKNQTEKVGSVHEVTEEKRKEIIQNHAMFVEEQMENFPYPTSMYIEHVKQMNVALRYHFFIPLENQKYFHFTFDYPKLEYAEIFTVISTLRIKGMEPNNYPKQLYVNHGYGKMLFPINLQPISISANKEVYNWESGSTEAFNEYIKKITEQKGIWKKKSTTKDSHTFESIDGNEIITITIKGKTITYEFNYPNR